MVLLQWWEKAGGWIWWDTGAGRVGRKGMARWFALSTCIGGDDDGRRSCARQRGRGPRLLDWTAVSLKPDPS